MKQALSKKLLPHHHTGKIRHHRHTSYGSLVVVLLLAFTPLMMISRSIASAAATDPVSGDHTTYAVVRAEPPATAPVITNIASGTVYTNNDPISVAGTCPDGTLVKIFKNEVFAGAALCEAGRFTLLIGTFVGMNSLIARAYNANNDVSPDSAPISVRQEIAAANVVGSNQSVASADQFFITSEIYHKGVNAGESLSWPVVLSGGQPPYAVSIGWGDGKTDLISRAEAGSFDVRHTYDKPSGGYRGSYTVTIRATDEAGQQSFLQLVSIVSGTAPGVVGEIKRGYNWSGTMRIAWQLMAVALLLVLSFWIGEKHELKALRKAKTL